MKLEELRNELAAMLALEEDPPVNWSSVERLSERTYERLELWTPQDFPREDVIGYLAGFKRRSEDVAFREQQHEWVRAYLRS